VAKFILSFIIDFSIVSVAGQKFDTIITGYYKDFALSLKSLKYQTYFDSIDKVTSLAAYLEIGNYELDLSSQLSYH